MNIVFLLVESREIMSAQVFSLEQVCQERADWYPSREARTRLKLSARGVEPMVTSRHNLHEVLRRLVTVLTLSLPLNELLQALTTLLIQALDVDLCVVLLREHETLHTCLCTPDLSDEEVILRPVQVSEALWEQMRAALQRGQMPDLTEVELEQLN